MLDSIHYYPLINGDTDGTEKFPLFHTMDEDYIRSSHDYYLEEVVSKYYRICVGRGVIQIKRGHLPSAVLPAAR